MNAQTEENHANLQESLADQFRKRALSQPRFGMVITEIALDGNYSSKGRLDVVVCTSTQRYKKIFLRGYEVKASRADLLSDLRKDKWRQYLDVCTEFSFAYPKGTAKPEEIPEEAGIIEWNGNSWNVVRRAPKLGDGTEETTGPTRDTLMRILWRYGNECRDAHWRVKSAETSLQYLRRDYERLQKDYEEVCEAP